MYINPQVYRKANLTMPQLVILQLVRQKDYNEEESLLSDVNINYFSNLKTKGYIERMKSARKSDPEWKAVRLTKKGRGIMRDMEIANITDQSKRLATALISLYKNNNLEINKNNNKRDVHELVAWFLVETDFASAGIYAAVADYINSNERKYISTLSNLIWKADNVYARHKNLSKSKLYGLMT